MNKDISVNTSFEKELQEIYSLLDGIKNNPNNGSDVPELDTKLTGIIDNVIEKYHE